MCIAPGCRQLDPVLCPEILPESLGRCRAALSLGTLLTDQATDELFHRHADLTRLSQDLSAGSISRTVTVELIAASLSDVTFARPENPDDSKICCQDRNMDTEG